MTKGHTQTSFHLQASLNALSVAVALQQKSISRIIPKPEVKLSIHIIDVPKRMEFVDNNI